jgi:hypothetical protein
MDQRNIGGGQRVRQDRDVDSAPHETDQRGRAFVAGNEVGRGDSSDSPAAVTAERA